MSLESNSKRSSGRTPKPKADSGETATNDKKVRSCPKTGCLDPEPSCCLTWCSKLCSKAGYTSRWYHMSLGEHFCNNCFDNLYRPNKPGHKDFCIWRDKWSVAARASKPNIKQYVVNELLPYWVKCTYNTCSKWRKLETYANIDHRYIKNFTCSSNKNITCATAEDSNVSLVLDHNFMGQLTEEPLLKESPAGPFLKRFIPEDVGLCPTNCSDSFLKGSDNVQPFSLEQVGDSTIWIKPDQMDENEESLAYQVSVSRSTYLGVRNFLIALWNLCPNKWLTIETVNQYLICRGLVRIYLLSVAGHILDLITKKCVINFGIIQNPSLSKWMKTPENNVLIVGAGISGLSAASHLHNLGYDVTVFEATTDLGGRVKDVPTTGSGAFVIQGLKNNPFFVLGSQAEAHFQLLEDNIVLFRNKTQISEQLIQKTQQELNGLLHGCIESMSSHLQADSNCYDLLLSNCIDMRKLTPFCQDLEIFKHLLSLSEIDFKADIKYLSVLNWEFVTSLIGKDGFIPNGLRLILIKLAQRLKITYNEVVKTIDYSANNVKVTTSSGEHIFSKVLVTVPLSVLQNEIIKFVPSLPEFKLNAFNNLGSFYCEKLIMEFPYKFWSNGSLKSFNKFGIVASEHIFELFLDVTTKKEKSTPTLVAFIAQKSFPLIKDLTNNEILDKVMSLLKTTFSKKVSYPTNWFLTNWKDCQYGGAYGCYVKVGSSPSAFDELARSIDNKVYFAGDATFRSIPSTLSGAYLSGLREAAKIIKDFESE